MRILVVLFVAACAHASGTGSAGFSIAYPDATTAKVGKKFYAKPAGQCRYENGRDARWAITGARVTSGELPPGVSIEDGALTGTPTKAGAYQAQIAFSGVTCAGKELAEQTIDVAISVR
jgi:hypothetical protein